MSELNFYLMHLRNKIFKLLPMREDYDNGQDNHLFEYIENLELNCRGAKERFVELKRESSFCEIQNDLCLLRTSSLPFSKWRNIVLRDTRKVNALIKEKEGRGGCGS